MLVRNLPSTSENYEPAWKILRDYYENKRLLVRAYLSSFVSLTKMKSESAVELRNVLHGFKAVASLLGSIGRPVTNSEDLFVYMTVELLDPHSRREWETSIGDTTLPPSCDDLVCFLDQRLHTLEALASVKPESNPKSRSSSTKAARSHIAKRQEYKAEDKRGRCSLCKSDHFVMLCDEYKKKTALDRK